MAKRRIKTQAVVLSAAILLLLIAAVAAWVWLSPGEVVLEQPVTVEIPGGAGSRDVAELLTEAGVVKNATSFVFYVRSQGAEADLRPGGYTFEGRLGYAEVLAALKHGGKDGSTIDVTVPEGKTVPQIAAVWEDAGLCSAEDFLRACAELQFDYDFLPEKSPDGEEYNRLEGFLYPETYNVKTDWQAEDLVKLQVGQFARMWTAERRAAAEALGLSPAEVVTVASMVEREARLGEERPLIASVIYNRLAIGQLLQIDATIQYILGEQVDRVLYKHLEIDSPYNTYLYSGLPPGPICSPGVACIDAALNPAETEYYYYRTKNDGSGGHNFARTYAEHQAYGAA